MNRLADETSPYLKQHADNPVDWYAWGDEAFAEARRSNRPVLLSVGYSACHWCHVMAHESFEDPATAAVMNEKFVSIKVDREERPDVDGIYMQAVQAMTGQGGWPMTVFCTPDGVPFYGGTYFPPVRHQGMPAFTEVLHAVSDAFTNNPDAVAQTGGQLQTVMRVAAMPAVAGQPTIEMLERAAEVLVDQTDFDDGGFGRAPKFPHPAALDLLLRRWQAAANPECWEAASVSLDQMARGGVYDQIGGGFHRYSVDERWAVPHFEKMLYDNAQLIPVYLHAYQLSGRDRFLRVVTETCDYVLREMRIAGGAFAAAQDADSEGEEGRFFVWNRAQLDEALGVEDGDFAAGLFGVTDEGNFEGAMTVLSLPRALEDVAADRSMAVEELERHRSSIRDRLYAVRSQRIAPARDDKVLTSWNALMVRALAEAGAALERSDYVDAACVAADFLLRELRVDGTVLRTWRDGAAKITGFLEDVAFLTDALLTVYEATGDQRWFTSAEELATDMVGRFWSADDGFFDTAVDGEKLLVRPRTLDDNPLPAGQSVAAIALLRLYAFTGEQRWREVAMSVVGPLAPAIARAPLALASLAQALDLAVTPPREVAVAGAPHDPATLALVRELHTRFDWGTVLAWGASDDAGVPLLEGRTDIDGRPAAYVCRNFACERPVTDPAELRQLLG